MQKAIFLDRDGVIIENRSSYVRSWADVAFYPQAFEALRIIHPAVKIVIITNQSAVGRGLISLETAHELNLRIEREIRSQGGRVDAFYLCPHAPEQACQCRKPLPGLILQAAAELEIDLPTSILIGDALTDILAGKNAGIRKNILVETGRGSQQIPLLDIQHIENVLIYKDLLTAIRDQPAFLAP